MANLTQKQEKFCLMYMETGNASEAYRQSYDAENMKPESINRKAKELMDNGKIAARIKEFQSEAAGRTKVTLESLINELDEAREVALGAQTPQSSAAVAAIMGKAKLLGFDITKTEITGKGGGSIAVKSERDMTDEELAIALANHGIKS